MMLRCMAVPLWWMNLLLKKNSDSAPKVMSLLTLCFSFGITVKNGLLIQDFKWFKTFGVDSIANIEIIKIVKN